MKKANYVVSVLCAILGITIIAISSGYPTTADYGTGVPGPGLWPICISVVLLLCAAILVLKSFKTKPEDEKAPELWSVGTRRVYISMIALAIYIALLEPLGFILPTTAMLFAFIQWFGKKKWYITLAVSAASTLIVYFAFKLLLNVPIDFGLFAL